MDPAPTFARRFPPLAAAWSVVPKPENQVGWAWLAATILREHRGSGHVTAPVGVLRREVEDLTSRLATGPVESVGETGVTQAIALGAPVGRHLMDGGVIPVPNPAGAPQP
jgi:hypothetical protein